MAREAAGEVDEGAGLPESRRQAPLLPWLDAPLRAIVGARERLAHALLLTGMRGIGKRNLAMHAAQALLCESPAQDGVACGHCASCAYFAAGTHPDFRMLDRWRYDDGDWELQAGIGVADVRALRDLAEVSAHRGGAKVAIIVPAEAMNHSAANALLKTLEEPTPGMVLILVADQPGRLPATILSRCRRIVVPPPSRHLATAWLAREGVADAALLLAQAGGAPLAARALAGAGLQAERAHWYAALANPRTLSPMALSARVESGPREARREQLAQAIDWLIGWSTDLARAAAEAPVRLAVDHAEAIGRLAPSVARVALSRYHRTLLAARERIAHPLAPRLVAESLLNDYRNLFIDGRR